MRLVSAKLALWVGALLIGASAVGCCRPTDYRPFDAVTVSLDDSLRDPTDHKLPVVEVNLIAVNDIDLPTWMALGVDDYFHHDHEKVNTVVLHLGESRPSQTLSVKDADPKAKEIAERLWKAKDKNLVILCDYPPLKPGTTTDVRRKHLELVCPNWPQGQTEITVRVTSDGMMVR